jgi:pimeloyl-ACP methyl ester carboxylesterase
MAPSTKYAKCGNIHIAYQVIGDGPIDLVFVPGLASHLEFQWEEPTQARFFRRLAAFCRLIRFDKRGVGLSDRLDKMPTLEERMEDVRAVMDEVGSMRAALLGLSEGGPLSLLFSATYPDRTIALILWNTYAKLLWAEDYKIGVPIELISNFNQRLEQSWGRQGKYMKVFCPSFIDDLQFRAWWEQFERLALSPGAALEALLLNEKIDVRELLSLIRVPTLVINNVDDQAIPNPMIKYLTERIPHAKYVEVPGVDHFAWRERDGVTSEIEKFLTGKRSYTDVDRQLATVLFTDIVRSTEQAVDLGDQTWRNLLDRHDKILRQNIERFRGEIIDTAGDGMLASFDGPARAIHCACTLIEEIPAIGINIRIGIHTGEVEVRKTGIAGVAVHIGARIAALAGENEILVSNTVKDLVVGSGISFSDRGWHELKGLPEKWHLLSVNCE